MTKVCSCSDMTVICIRTLRLWEVRKGYDHEVFTIWYDYDTIMIRRVCVCVCLWYDILWCNMLWYDMYVMKCYVKTWNIMLCLLNCVYTAWYECHEIMINGMKYNPVKIMYDIRNDTTLMKNDREVIFDNVENGKILGPHAFCVLMHWGIPLFHHEGTDAYYTRQVKYHYVFT